ncbi:hypothetical protein LIER_22173 [Lithospermum erythrorhizon]|uniref:Reverse transcriptase domain-containing protein n=1 Tax=Lithospermum erythrorhizon TaxID=34254 RepID=A0AAV3QU13_LITER
MPKFKTFSGFGDPSNHLKSFDSLLSFWTRDDEICPRAFPSSLSGQASNGAGRKTHEERPRKSTKRGRVWERLQKPKEREEGRHHKPQDPTFISYTPLRVLVGIIYAQLEDKRILPKLQRINTPPNRRDQKKYCEYHKDHGHDTDECRVLKAEIEMENELVGLELPHDDPLVANFMVSRMLVDTGSSADILYLQAYDRLGLPGTHLEPVCTPLTGFTGHSVYPTGIAELDLVVGESP